MNKLKIIFFDTTWNQLIRFGNKISELIKFEYNNIISIGVVCEEIIDETSRHSFDLVYDSKKNLDIADFITKTKPDITVLVQNTVPDQNVILRAKKAGSFICVLQHGMLYEGASLNNFNLHEIIAAAFNLKKTLKYLVTMWQMCKYDGQSYFKLVKRIIIERSDVARILQNHFSVKLNGDCAMVIGEYWIDYYCEHYDYDRQKVLLMGNHDVDNMVLDKPLENAICYIPSVHVEDGKIRESVFHTFVEALAQAIDLNTKFYIKMHPRGNINLYKDAFKYHNVTYVTDSDLPYVTTYIGHNSTLLAKALMLTNKVILWGFKEETELFYRPWAYAFCKNTEELKEAVDRALSDETKDEAILKEIRSISYINPEGAFQFAARSIIELYNSKNGLMNEDNRYIKKS